MSGETGETTLIIYKVHSFARHSSFYRSLNFCFDTGIWSKITKILLKIRTARIIWISLRLLQEKKTIAPRKIFVVAIPLIFLGHGY